MFASILCGTAVAVILFSVIEKLESPIQAAVCTFIILGLLCTLSTVWKQVQILQKDKTAFRNIMQTKIDQLALIIREKEAEFSKLSNSHQNELAHYRSISNAQNSNFWSELHEFDFADREQGRKMYEHFLEDDPKLGPAMPKSHALALALIYDQINVRHQQHRIIKNLKECAWSEKEALEQRLGEAKAHHSSERARLKAESEHWKKETQNVQTNYDGLKTELEQLRQDYEKLENAQRITEKRHETLKQEQKSLQGMYEGVQRDMEQMRNSKYADIVKHAKEENHAELNSIFESINNESGTKLQPYLQAVLVRAVNIGLITPPPSPPSSQALSNSSAPETPLKRQAAPSPSSYPRTATQHRPSAALDTPCGHSDGQRKKTKREAGTYMTKACYVSPSETEPEPEGSFERTTEERNILPLPVRRSPPSCAPIQVPQPSIAGLEAALYASHSASRSKPSTVDPYPKSPTAATSQPMPSCSVSHLIPAPKLQHPAFDVSHLSRFFPGNTASILSGPAISDTGSADNAPSAPQRTTVEPFEDEIE